MSSGNDSCGNRGYETGPVYNVRLIDALPLGHGGMLQALPTRKDLERVFRLCQRTASGYEVLLEHYHEQCAEVRRLKDVVRTVIDGHWSPTTLQEAIGDLRKGSGT